VKSLKHPQVDIAFWSRPDEGMAGEIKAGSGTNTSYLLSRLLKYRQESLRGR
jgi:hypothetical protein